MPALVNSSVGSFCGTSEEECTSRWPFSMKKSRNMRRIWEPVGMSIFESPYGWNPIHLRNFNSKPLWTRKILTTEDTKEHEGKTKHAILIVVFGDWQTSLLIPAWGGKYFLCEPLCPPWLFLVFTFQRSQHLFVHIPLFQDGEDGFGAKSRAYQLAEDAGSLFSILRLGQALALQICAGLLFFVNFAEDGRYSGVDHVAVDPFRFQIGDHAQAAEFFV